MDFITNSCKNVERFFKLIFCLAVLVLVIQLPVYGSGLINEMFWQDTRDTAGDFFNSIVCTHNRDPYGSFKTLYTPLSNMFFYYLYLCLPPDWTLKASFDMNNYSKVLRLSNFDLRTWQASLALFLIYVQFTGIMAFCVFKRYIKSHSGFISLILVNSIGMLYALERGNIITLVLLLITFFIFEHSNKCCAVRYFSYLCLGIAVGLKIYPILFSLMLLRERNIRVFFIVLFLSLLLLIVPFFFFNGFSDIRIWLDVLIGHGNNISTLFGREYIGFQQFWMYLFSKSAYFGSIASISSILNYIIVFFLLVNAIISTSTEESVLSIALVIVLGQSVSPVYNSIFLIPSFMLFLNSDNNNKYKKIFWTITLIPFCFGTHGKIYYILKSMVLDGMYIYVAKVSIENLYRRLNAQIK